MILSRDIGIDLGTATTMICDRKGRIIVREPSVVAVDVKTKRVVATGTQAKHPRLHCGRATAEKRRHRRL